MKNYQNIIKEKDSINLVEVKTILKTYGWLGRDIVGLFANAALFLVIQHADPLTQKTYLPMMRKAVTKGNARGADPALLEDRVALNEGRKQRYILSDEKSISAV
jgi:hypothetical protein